MWSYKITEHPSQDNNWHTVYTVGFYSPNGDWFADEDFTDRNKARQRVNYLNGGTTSYAE